MAKSELKTALAWLAPKLLLLACWVLWAMVVTMFATILYTPCGGSVIGVAILYLFLVFGLPLLVVLVRMILSVKSTGSRLAGIGRHPMLVVGIVLVIGVFAILMSFAPVSCT